MGAGILPVALYRGTLFLLLGQERNNNLWSDFGGGSHKGEKPFKTGIREGTEELNGFFGTEEELEEEVNNNIVLSICYDKYTSYIFRTKYNKDLPKYFSNNNKFIEKQASNIINSKENGLYEKKFIGWFPINKFYMDANIMKNRTMKNKAMLRSHFQEHIMSIVKNEEFIIEHIKNIENC
jgi:8-oxo-dGTP pyrophosphatase MutT (NUDIX family)